MAERPLTPDEAALWARVIGTVQPMEGRVRVLSPTRPEPSSVRTPRAIPASTPPVLPRPTRSPATLDGGWDRRLTRGQVLPDRTVDLHGHTLDTAYRTLDAALAQAIAADERVVLLVTGKPPRPDSERPHARGRIRAAVGDWLGASRHADAIAAVRGAHPRHGGNGALYIILRRRR